VAGSAHLRVLALEARSVKPGSVRIESPSPLGRVTGQAVTLGVTADARLQALSRGLAVPQEKELFRIMEARPQRLLSHQAGLLMAVSAKTGGTVAVGAGGFPSIGRRGMAGQEVGRMEPTDGPGAGSVAVETLGPGMAGRTTSRRRRRERSMIFREVFAMSRRPGTDRFCPLPSSRFSGG
jgi:hypothetical protein